MYVDPKQPLLAAEPIFFYSSRKSAVFFGLVEKPQ